MFKADDYRLKIKALEETLGEAKYALDIDNIGEKLKELKAEQEKPEVWNDLEKSKHIGREISVIEGKIAAYNKGESALKDAQAFVDLIEEADDESLVPELEKMINSAESDIEEMRIKALLKGKYDANNAILSLHAGAGGVKVPGAAPGPVAADLLDHAFILFLIPHLNQGFNVLILGFQTIDLIHRILEIFLFFLFY